MKTENLTISRPMILLLFSVMLTGWVNAQSNNGAPVPQELYDEIASLDSSFFEAYNTCNLAKIETFFTEDLEFYHDKSGLTTTRKSAMEIMKNSLCGDPGNRVRRELVKGSLQVYPMNNYGALAIGEHRFYLTQKGQKEKLDGIAKFANLWQKKDGQWRMSRVLSYDHKPAQ